MKKRVLLVLLLVAAGGALYAYTRPGPDTLVLTGVVTTDDVLVSPQIAGLVQELRVVEGEQVKKGQTLALIAPEELQAETAYYAQNAAGLKSHVRESEAALRLEQRQTADQIAQAESALAASEAQV
jgi:multidrug efflux pump subunit AcrA (membrane-fusion protein)